MQDGTAPPKLRHPARPAWRVLLGAVLLGAIAALGQAPFGVWGLGLIGLGTILWQIGRAARPLTAAWLALAAGFGWFALSMCWIVEPFLVESEIYGWMAPFALFLMALGGGLFWAVPVWLACRISSGNWRAQTLAAAAALILSDWLRGWIFTGLPWALTGHIWIDTPVAQHASWLGATGLSAITLITAALPAILWHPIGSTARHATGFIAGIAAAAVIIGGLWAAGLNRLAQPLPADHPVTLRLVQPNATQNLKWDPEWAGIFFQRLMDLSSAPGQRDLVIWPETAVNFLLNDADQVLPVLTNSTDAPLILGIQRAEGTRYYNSLALLDRSGEVTQIYDKFHLVPFGEYIPWGDAMARIGISAFAAQQGKGYSPGPGPQILNVPGLPDLQPLICYEAIFPQHLRAAPSRPGWLLQITNDGWFGNFSGPYQHLAQARLRAIQSGLPIVRVANTGISAVIDAHGHIRDSLPLNTDGKIDAALPAALPATIWWRLGDWPAVILAVLLLLASAALARRSDYSRK